MFLIGLHKHQTFPMQRKILISKDMMRNKYKVKSPNMADALIMAVSLIGDVVEVQERQYSHHAAYSQEESLFGLAGVR